MKIIPAVDLMEGKVVRLVKGEPQTKKVYSNTPSEIAKKWEKAGADMIHAVDLDATLGRGSNLETLIKIVKDLSIPVQIAGGLRDEKTITESLNYAARVVLGTIAFTNEQVLQSLLKKYGKDRIVIALDHIDGIIVIDGWKKKTGIKLIEGIDKFVKMGFTEFLLTNVSKDGTLLGPDLKNLQLVCEKKEINVIASGGISSIDDVIDIKECKAAGVILGKALYENLITIEDAKKIA